MPAAPGDLEIEFGTDILLRRAVWLTIKESRASFLIEHEENQSDRIRRFAKVLEKRSGTAPRPLEAAFLAKVQHEILGQRALRTGPRRSPVFIGETGRAEELIHYVAPNWEQVEPMLRGLEVFSDLTKGTSSVIRAAVISFGFVYIHPRWPMATPHLAVPGERHLKARWRCPRSVHSSHLRNDRGLSGQSGCLRPRPGAVLQPFMDRFVQACRFGRMVTTEDGVGTNFQFSAYEETRLTWAFPDLTDQAVYLGNVIQQTLGTEMRQEAKFLLDLRQSRARVKEVMEAPDVELDRIIRSVRDNQGVISGRLAQEYPVLEHPEAAIAVINAIMRA